MKLIVQDKEINIKYSFKGFMAYEQITGESFKPQGLSEIITLFYSMVMTSNNNLTITFDEFIDWLDENPEKLSEFSIFLAENVKRQEELAPKTEGVSEKGENSGN